MPLKYPGHPRDVPLDFEDRCIDWAMKTLQDIPCCRSADYKVRWFEGLPMLIIEFGFIAPGSCECAALGIGLVKVQKGTLLQAYPGNELFRGEKLRDHVLYSVHDYLNKVGVKIGLQL